MGADASCEPIDDAPMPRPTADLPTEQEPAAHTARTEMRMPSQAERMDAQQQARLAADRAYAKSIGEQISAGHAFDKHVIERNEFPGVTTRGQFADVIADVVMNGKSRYLEGDRTAFWRDGTLVIRNPAAADGGTTFRPANGHDYFVGLH